MQRSKRYTPRSFLDQSGQLFMLALIVLSVVMVGTVIILSGSLTFKQNTRYSLDTLDVTNLAEAGIDKAVAAMNATGGTYNGEPETFLGSGSYSVTVTSVNVSTKKIQVTGYIPNKSNPKTKRTIEILISQGIGTSFNYGVQAGEGGIEMKNSARINGSVFTNGNITMENSARINGSAIVARGTQPTPNQQTECDSQSPGSCNDFIFGKSVSGNNQLDVAQSFKPTQAAVINKVALKLLKVGSPPNVTVRILGDTCNCASGDPDKNNVLASGTLNANLVGTGTQYGFADVVFSFPPTLSPGTIYWIMIDTSADDNNYWKWSLDTLGSYSEGNAKWSPAWSIGNQVWNNISGDLAFKTFMGGVATSINGTQQNVIQNDARGNTLSGVTVLGDAYYQAESGITVSGQSCLNNAHCHPNSTDPAPEAMPLSQTNIDEWKQQAASANPSLPAPDCNSQTVWGPGKYTGDISLATSCIETVKSPILITGNLTMSNTTEMKLDPQLGSSSGVIIVDNFITLDNTNKLSGTGTPGSYLFAISEFNSRDDPSGRDAITVVNSGNQGVLYSNLGSISISNTNTLTEVTAWKLKLSNNTVVNYDQGMASTFFSSGPSGSYSVVKGTYLVK